MKEKHRQVILIKKFDEFEDKIIYQGTLRKAKKLIPSSQADRYEIQYLDLIKKEEA